MCIMASQTLILASGSSARADMLSAAGIPISIDLPRIDEDLIKASMSAEAYPPRDIADALAEAKARKVSLRNPGQLVLGSDQILVANGTIFDKPPDLNAARDHLMALKGQTHRLITAAVMIRDGEVTFRHIEIAKLVMRDFSDDFLDAYLKDEGEEILACVGAYRLEGWGAQLFQRVEGDYFTILGLPLLACLEHLRDQGILIR